MYHATELIAKAMDAKGMKYSTKESERNSRVSAAFGVDNGPSVTVEFVSTDNDNDVAVRLFGLIAVKDEEKKVPICAALNQLNAKYRYLKFVMDEDGDVNVEFDVPNETSSDCVGEVCCEIFIRMMRIVDSAYPVLMRAMWM